MSKPWRKKHYKEVAVKNHPLFPGRAQVPVHRLVVAERLGRRLLKSEHVHHENEDIADNSDDNLELLPHGEHTKHHRVGMRFSPEWKQKISEGRRKQLQSLTPEQRKQLYGHPTTAESLAKIKAKRQGWKPTKEHVENVAAKLRGRKLPPRTEEHKRKLSEAAKLRWSLHKGS